MHTGPVPGDFTDDWKLSKQPNIPCHKCGVAGRIFYREWESSCGGYDDVKLTCRACGYVWWVEGADS